jgi:asparagine synthase (glutamine-hydrolysing)
MKSGLYAIASLDGAPLSQIDCHALGLGFLPEKNLRQLDGCVVRAFDHDSEAIDFAVFGGRLSAFLGFLDEPDDLARQLGLPLGAAPAELALAALEQFGDEAPSRMLGEWSMLCWRADSRKLTLLASEACRDPMFFATNGRFVAVAPELRVLAKLDWVGATLDVPGFLLQLSRARLRRILKSETVLKGGRRIVPGTVEVIGAGTRSTGFLAMPAPQELWQGSFEEGVAALEAVLRRIMRQHLQRYGTVAFLLSGGLDSSLLAWLGSEEKKQAQNLFFISSVANIGSNIPDEREYSQLVAKMLGLPIEFVCPEESASVYRPSAGTFAQNELPVVSPWHYLYDALYSAANTVGSEAVFDGRYGEMTLTNALPLVTSDPSVRQRVRRVISRLKMLHDEYNWPSSGFHVRLSMHALDTLPAHWGEEWHSPFDIDPQPREQDLWGFRPSIRKNAMSPSATTWAGFRNIAPYRDRRLLSLAATMPASFLHHNGMNRALGRAMLKDRLPDAIRLRKSGSPFSPDYPQRMRRQTSQPLARMSLFRAAGADEWLDLGWLERALADLGKGKPAKLKDMFQIQMTTIAAEFIVWWKGVS